jgi:hypothetical protein
MRQPAFSGFGHNRLRKRMLGFHLDGCGVLQQIEGGPVGIAAKVYNTVADDHVGDARLPFGERPGLIKRDDLHRRRAFEMDTALEQNAAPRRATDRGEDGRRRADDQRARGRNDHHGHGPVESGLKRFLQEHDRHNDQPDREENHAGGIELLGAIEKALGLALLGLCFLDHAHQLFYRGILRIVPGHAELPSYPPGKRKWKRAGNDAPFFDPVRFSSLRRALQNCVAPAPRWNTTRCGTWHRLLAFTVYECFGFAEHAS